MTRSARLAFGICTVLVAAWQSAACGGSAESHPNGTASAGTSAASSMAGTGTLSLGGGTSSTGGDGSGGLADTCAADVTTAQPVPLDMYIMLDTSGSMAEPTSSALSKWEAVKTALESFLKDKASAGIGVGLQYFPLEKPNAPTSCSTNADCGDSGPCFLKACSNSANLVACDVASDCVDPATNRDYGPCAAVGECAKDHSFVCGRIGRNCTDPNTGADLGLCSTITTSYCMNTESCDAAQYAAPAATISALPGAEASLVASIESKMPNGATPTAPALSGAIQQASAWAKAHTGHRVVAVLATDGLPTQCMPTAIAQVSAIAKAGVAATPSINTFVIGVFGSADIAQGAPGNLDEIAQQGGTKSAFLVDTQKDVTAQFLSALDAIRGTHLSCEFQIPQPAGNQTLEYGHVNVRVSSDGKDSNLFYVAKASACDATSGGWYYDVDPAAGTPTRIIACPASCTAYQAATNASISIALGCVTIVK